MSSKAHVVAVVQNTVNFRRLVLLVRVRAVLEISLTARFDDRNVLLHDEVFRSRHFFQRARPCAMVPMRMADEQNLDVAESKAKLLDAIADKRDRIVQAAVNKDMSLWGRDQKRSESLCCRRNICSQSHDMAGKVLSNQEWPEPRPNLKATARRLPWLKVPGQLASRMRHSVAFCLCNYLPVSAHVSKSPVARSRLSWPAPIESRHPEGRRNVRQFGFVRPQLREASRCRRPFEFSLLPDLIGQFGWRYPRLPVPPAIAPPSAVTVRVSTET